jgi:hypothetical protein
MLIRRLVLMSATVVMAAAIALPIALAAPGKRHKHIHFTDTIVGAGIGGNRAVFSIHDSIHGNGAGTQTVTPSGSGGSDTEIVYYGDATATSKGTFTLGAPDANGVASLSGSGHDVRGTGKLRRLRSSFSYSGTLNTKTGAFRIILSGTESF